MILRHLRHAGWPALFACAALAACSKTPATQVVYMEADIAALQGSPELCGSAGNVLALGSRGNTNVPTTVADGDNGVTVNCSVKSSGDGFDIQLDASQPGSQGAQEIVIAGHVTKSGGTVQAQFVSAAVGQFISKDCKLDYSYLGVPITSMQPITGGAIWAHIDCTDAVDKGRQIDLSDGGTSQETCEGTADFLFQNCDE